MSRPLTAWLEDADPEREVVHIKWGARSEPIYAYADELELPDHQRTHLIGGRP